MALYNGWTIVTMPSSPAAPASFEFSPKAVVGAVTNPFTGQQQIHDFGGRWAEASVSFAPMLKSQAVAWKVFAKAVSGPLCVFQFGATFCAAYPDEFTTNGTTPRYWRLKGNPQWTVSKGGFMALTFEIREAI